MSALRNVLRSQTLARASVGLVYRSPHSLEDLLELLPKPFQLGDLIRHRIKLRPNQRAKPRTKRGMPASIECVHQCLELLERQPQRAGSTDEPQPLHAGLIVESVARRGASRRRQYSDLLVVPNRFRRYPARLGDFADRETGGPRLPPSVESRPTIGLPVARRSRGRRRASRRVPTLSRPQHAQGRRCYDARQKHVSSRRSRDQSWIEGRNKWQRPSGQRSVS